MPKKESNEESCSMDAPGCEVCGL